MPSLPLTKLISLRRFLDGALDVYKNPLYYLAVEYYLFEIEHSPPETYKCLMTDCRDKYNGLQEMLRHLKNCEFLRQGLFSCPICNSTENFHAALKRRLTLSQKLQEKFKEFLKSFKSSSSSTKMPHSQWSDQAGAQSSPSNSSAQYQSGDVVPQHLPSVSESCSELLGETQYLTHQKSQLGQLILPEPYGLCCSTSSQSNSPAELSSVSESRAGTWTTEISPTSSAQSLKPASNDGYTHYGHLPTNSNQSTESNHAHLDNFYYPEQPHDSLHHSQSTQSYDEPHSFGHIPPQYAPSQLGFRINQTSPLSIDTNPPANSIDAIVYQLPSSNNMSWLDTCDMEEKMEDSSSTSFQRTIPLQPNCEANSDSLMLHEKFVAVQNTPSFDVSSHMDSDFISLSPEQPPDPELPQSGFRCPHCPFTPSGKKTKNYAAYLRKHIRSHEDHQVKCEYCGKPYTRGDNKEVHVRKIHGVPSDSKRRHSPDDIDFVNQKRTRNLPI